MRHLWSWLKDRWLEHQACKPQAPVLHGRPQVYMPIVSIAEDAYWRWRIGHPRR